MDHRGVIGALALVVALIATTGDAGAFDEAKYPNLKGQWRRIPVPGVVGQPGYDQTKIQGWKQEPPLTPEAAATLNASLADQAAGGQGGDPTYTCKSPGMPRIMTAYDPMEVVVTPDTVHIFIEHIHDSRRGVFDRPLDRYQGHRPLRPARGRDPRLPRAPGVRCHRDSTRCQQRKRDQGTDLRGRRRSRDSLR
jgi:hypothetical protein